MLKGSLIINTVTKDNQENNDNMHLFFILRSLLFRKSGTGIGLFFLSGFETNNEWMSQMDNLYLLVIIHEKVWSSPIKGAFFSFLPEAWTKVNLHFKMNILVQYVLPPHCGYGLFHFPFDWHSIVCWPCIFIFPSVHRKTKTCPDLYGGVIPGCPTKIWTFLSSSSGQVTSVENKLIYIHFWTCSNVLTMMGCLNVCWRIQQAVVIYRFISDKCVELQFNHNKKSQLFCDIYYIYLYDTHYIVLNVYFRITGF